MMSKERLETKNIAKDAISLEAIPENAHQNQF
jgi:hypothetical protein